MKRKKLIAHLRINGCIMIREGSNHSIYYNPAEDKISTVPRHPDVKQFIAEKICKDIEIPAPVGN